ncbi:hypothetical protein [Chitinimonas sp.]|uniref:hypothetical protein n=1 Tax=Chitinimonas sp. TaxID=1934313 RepID=UPI0035B45F7E
MTTYYYTPAETSVVLDALSQGSRLYSANDCDMAWIEQANGARQPLQWSLFEQLIQTGNLLPLPEAGRTRWALPDNLGLLRYTG